jgi:hypothetical protein
VPPRGLFGYFLGCDACLRSDASQNRMASKTPAVIAENRSADPIASEPGGAGMSPGEELVDQLLGDRDGIEKLMAREGRVR